MLKIQPLLTILGERWVRSAFEFNGGGGSKVDFHFSLFLIEENGSYPELF